MSDTGNSETQQRGSFLGWFRRNFITGVVIIAPAVISLWATMWFINSFDDWIKPLLPYGFNPDNFLPFALPGTGLVISLVMITLVGALAANLVGKTIIGYWDKLLDRTPVVRSIYKGSKQVFETLFSEKGTSFRHVCLVQWPRADIWQVAFISREVDGADIGLETGRRMFAVYVSTTPNPTGGYVFFVDKDDVKILNMSVEEGLKLVISMGLVFPDKALQPERERKLANLHPAV
jgi:uncharacterized membrane protein